MTALSIQPTYPILTDIDGQPLEDGYIFLGVINLDPIANPITAYWDAALTVTATQPIRTRGGYPMNAGAVGRLYVNSNYSIQVQNKSGYVVYSAPSDTNRFGDIPLANIVAGGANRVVFSNASSVLTTQANFTFDGTTLVAPNITDSSLTTGRVVFTTTGGNMTDSANLLYSGTDLNVYGLTVGRGGGAISTNTVVGSNALLTNTAGANNVAVGLDALRLSTASNNVAVGYHTLKANTTGDGNVAVGPFALKTNQTGVSNTAIGTDALALNTASNNTAVGNNALEANSSGAANTAVGDGALRLATTGGTNVAVGYLTAGNGVVTGSYNVAVGGGALFSHTSGSQNTAIGHNTLVTNTNGASNTAVGTNALYTAAASYNTAIGDSALYGNTSGTLNTALGWGAMVLATSGSRNTSIGAQSMTAVMTASDNVAVGYNALNTATTGDQNVCVGNYSGKVVTQGFNNVALGHFSMESTTTGDGNVAIGHSALDLNVGGNNNTALGRLALQNTTGSGNVCVGSVDAANAYNPCFDIVGVDNRAVFGSGAVTDAYVQVAWTVVSDARDKTEILPIDRGLAFVNQLNPVSFKFRTSRESEESHGPKRLGFLAQEVLALEDEPIVIDAEDPEKLRYRGEALVPILVKAVQELSARVAELEARLA